MVKKYHIYFSNGEKEERFVNCTKSERGTYIFEIDEELDYENIKYINVPIIDEDITAGDDGFFLRQSFDYGVAYFKERENAEVVDYALMSFCGVKHGAQCVVPIITGFQTDAHNHIKVENNQYFLDIRFDVSKRKPYENIKIEFYIFENNNATYVDFAKIYRNHQLNNGFKSLKERNNKYLSYMSESANIRIRMGWKPVPVQILEQTEENEPPMHVACTFDDVSKLLDEYKRIGIKKAEFCLVGWNKSGHDGRWPQILPVEEKLGGEEALKRLIAKADEYGYEITCHTNSTDAYSIADNFRLSDMAETRSRDISIQSKHWAGGRTYNICPKRAYEISMETLPEVAALGFRGMHYIDVITATVARECNSPLHPVNKKEACEYFNKLFAECKKMFGAIGSECSFDQSMRECDSTLYVSFSDFLQPNMQRLPIFDESVPLWQIVYHGIVFSTPYSRSINVMAIEEKDDLLKCMEYGARPQMYYYASFVNKTNGNWIGKSDLYCHNDEEIKKSAEIAKATEDVFSDFNYLQYEFIDNHKKLSNGVYETTYSDGSVVTVNYNDKTYSLKKAQTL